MSSPNFPAHSNQPLKPGAKRISQRKGVALILVVSFIVLLSALVVGFFSRVTTDLTGARSYAEGISARQLAESAVSVVMGQIRAATTITNGCWASQPGMIRVYGTSNGTNPDGTPKLLAGSQAYAFYKLYSSHNLVVTSFSSFNPNNTSPSGGANVEVPIGSGGWSEQPAFFTDLNQPADVPKASDPTKTEKRYPIFDPSVARIQALGQNLNPNTGGGVEGCEIDTKILPTSELTDASGKLAKAPMPVRWIYVLRDGTLTTPTPLSSPAAGNTGLKAVWNNIGNPLTPSTGVPSKDNPIVGRIAFWTDDDTCKVNINTAGGYVADESGTPDYKRASKTNPETNPAFIAGSFWDTPRVQTYFDRGVSGTPTNFRGGLASAQPVRNEFQRYPGHPSTTSFGLVMRGLIPATTMSAFTSELLYTMTPRLTPGASQGGSKQLVAYDMQLADPTEPDPPATIKRTYDPDPKNQTDSKGQTVPFFHLWSSVDDMYYTTLNTPEVKYPTLNNPSVAANGDRTTTDKELKLAKPTITPEVIDKARFFLTAHSRSPELNLIGRPRVTVWPIPTRKSEGALLNIKEDSSSSKVGIRNPSDDLIQFCSTVGANPNDKSDPQGLTRKGQFIFDREDPYSSTADFSRTRNRQIFTYLQEVTSNSKGKIPGWGQSFESKYSASGGRDQILTEIFDYIRTVNLKDTSRDQRIDKSQGRVIENPSKPPPQNPTAQKYKLLARYARQGFVVPTRVTVGGNKVSGFGRSPTISEVSLVLYHGGYIYKPKAGKEDVEYNPAKLKDETWKKSNEVTEELIRAFVIVETFDPMQGYGPVTNFDTGASERLVYEVTTMPDFKIKTDTMSQYSSLAIGSGKNDVYLTSGSTWAGRNFGGTEGFFHTMQGKVATNSALNSFPWGNATVSYAAAGSVGAISVSGGNRYYPFQSPCANKFDGVRIPYGDKFLSFQGGTMRMKLSYVDKAHDIFNAHNETIQEFQFTWPNGDHWPVPITEKDAVLKGEGFRQDSGGFDPTVGGFNSNDSDSVWTGHSTTWTNDGGYRMPFYLPLRINWAQQHSYSPWTKLNAQGAQAGNGKNYANRFLQILQPGDTIRSLVPGGTVSESTDPRTVHLQSLVSNFKGHPDYVSSKRRAQTLRCADGQFYFNPTNTVWFPNEAGDQASGLLAQLSGKTRYIVNSSPDLAKTVVAKQKNGGAADFDTGIGNFPDGGFCNKADEGNLSRNWKDEWGVWHYVEPYFSTWTYDSPGDTYFSPNRQIPSPVMFGSLLAPTTTMDKAGWKTLLFCPNPAAGYSQSEHQGFANPPDHLLLDLFNMPVVEPYAISEPFSTDGKVNLNYQMMPFGYIERSTALRAALHPLRITAIPNKFTRSNNGATELKYKGVANEENLRYLVDRDETIKSFNDFFKQYSSGRTGSGFFKSASQICEMFLYPKGTPINYNGKVTFTPGDSNIKTWWNSCSVTGDNVREKPYSDLYSRVTTKSNTYTVHYRVQSVRQRPYTGSASGATAYYSTWDESRDQVLSEYRGHTTIERYLDPRDSRFGTTINPEKDSLETAYRFRVVYNKRFSPW